MDTRKMFENILRQINKEVFANSFQLSTPANSLAAPMLEFKLPEGTFFRIQPLYQQQGSITQFEVWVDIGIPEIIDTYHRITTKAPKSFWRTSVLGNYLATIEDAVTTGDDEDNHKRTQYTIAQPNHVDIAVNEISQSLENAAVPWFEKYNTIAAIDNLLNARPTQPSAHVLLGNHRAYMGLIAARLNDNPNYQELKKAYSEDLAIGAGNTDTEFTALLALLDKNDYRRVSL